MKTVGLLGGLSWESTALYYQILNRRVRQKMGGLHSLPCIIHSVDFAEIAALQESGEWDRASTILADAACGLQAAGAQAIVICANTMHKSVPAIEAKCTLPILHIADLTGQEVRKAGFTHVALLATRYTMEQTYYKGRLEEKFGLKVTVPDKKGRDEVHRIVYEELCRGVVKPESRATYVEITNELISQGAQCLIMGCTEITMLLSQKDVLVPVFDTTAIHAEKAADWSMSIAQNDNEA